MNAATKAFLIGTTTFLWELSADRRLSSDQGRAAESAGVDGLAILSHIDTVEHAAKVMGSYFARLEFLAANQAEKTAMLVGLPQEGEGQPHP